MSNASLLRRIGAMIYDGLLLLAVLFASTLPVVALRGGEPIDPGNLPYRLFMAGMCCLFFIGFWYRYGRTLGMQSWGLSIEAMDGSRPTLGQCSLRFFLAIVSWAPFGLGFLWQLLDNDNMTWHDHLSGTRLRYYPKDKNSS